MRGSPGVQHAPRVPAGCRPSELDAGDALAQLAQPDDQAPRRMRLSRIHRAAANNRNVRLFRGESGRQTEIAQAKSASVSISKGSQDSQFARLGHTRVLALDKAAQSPHGKQITGVAIDARIAFELFRRISVPEHGRQQVSLIHRGRRPLTSSKRVFLPIFSNRAKTKSPGPGLRGEGSNVANSDWGTRRKP